MASEKRGKEEGLRFCVLRVFVLKNPTTEVAAGRQ